MVCAFLHIVLIHVLSCVTSNIRMQNLTNYDIIKFDIISNWVYYVAFIDRVSVLVAKE